MPAFTETCEVLRERYRIRERIGQAGRFDLPADDLRLKVACAPQGGEYDRTLSEKTQEAPTNFCVLGGGGSHDPRSFDHPNLPKVLDFFSSGPLTISSWTTLPR